MVVRQSVFELVNKLKNNDPELKEVNLDGQSLESHELQQIGLALSDNHVLSALNLEDTQGLSPTLLAVMWSLQTNRTLRRLNLSHTGIGREVFTRPFIRFDELGGDIHSLRRRILQDLIVFQILKRHNDFIDALISLVVGQVLVLNNSLEWFDMSRNPHSLIFSWAVAYALRGNRGLMYLDLSANEIGGGVVETLANSLLENKTLKMLELSDNNIEKNGLEQLSKMLCHNMSLVFLNLNANERINGNGMEFVGKMLGVNKTLDSLGLADCGIKDDGAECIAKGISANKNMSTLDFSGNNFGERGTNAIGEALRFNFFLINYTGPKNENIVAFIGRNRKNLRHCTQLMRWFAIKEKKPEYNTPEITDELSQEEKDGQMTWKRLYKLPKELKIEILNRISPACTRNRFFRYRDSVLQELDNNPKIVQRWGQV